MWIVESIWEGILYKADWDSDLQKKRTLYQNSLYELKTHFWQIWGCWFQIWQQFFKILAQNNPNKAFLLPNLVIFVFSQNFAIRQIWGCWFQIWQYCFHSNSSPKIPKSGIFGPKFRYFCFSFVKFCKSTNFRVLISNMTIVF